MAHQQRLDAFAEMINRQIDAMGKDVYNNNYCSENGLGQHSMWSSIKSFFNQRPPWFWGGCVILGAFLIRLISLGLYPLMDTSEARYGEMVRLMVETNDWITPYFDYDFPFWGKPPLFIWLSALSFHLFGINEFAARLPSLLVSAATLGLTWKLASFQYQAAGHKHHAHLAALILTTTAMFLVLSGALLADPVMLLSITLTLTAFWIGWNSQEEKQANLWRYLFFVGCAISLLAKGPAALVLAGLPIFFWCLPKKRLVRLWQSFPWVKGTLLCALIALPWYIIAELKTPGFLEYFLVGEHFGRYLEEGWEDDRYGAAHIRPLGTIWIRFLQGGFPWSLALVVIGLLWVRSLFKREDFKEERSAPDFWQSFLLCWLIAPLVFFTFASNIIWTYALPVMPPLALLLADRWGNQWPKMHHRLLATATVTPVLTLIMVIVMMNDGGKKSQKYLVAAMKEQQVDSPGHLLYLSKRPFSARYYSAGKAILVEQTGEILSLIDNDKTDFLATKKDRDKELPKELQERFTKVASYRDWTLWQERDSTREESKPVVDRRSD